MFDSLATQYLVPTPDYHPITLTAGCISVCVAGISPVLELGQRVLVDCTIIQHFKPLSRKVFDLLTYLFCKHNWRLGVSSPTKRMLAGVPTPRI